MEIWQIRKTSLGDCVILILLLILCLTVNGSLSSDDVSCDDLQEGQYKCDDPEIDPVTQAAVGCVKKDRTVSVPCRPAPGVKCDGIEYNGTTVAKGLRRTVPCRYTNGYSYTTSLLLSIFLGMFGLDRMYLGYPALGLLKFCTMGLLFVGQFLDVILIATQVVGPADGSDYVLDYYGPILKKNPLNNETYYMPQEDYHL
ncbi:TM2 domain-containing protein 1-like [Amphiura filiformis]|uniref:TM2 domain-containing protein 1-like n=1 Tax=Amphiura filiformis TaxID=82378 RepID=UPI003B228168